MEKKKKKAHRTSCFSILNNKFKVFNTNIWKTEHHQPVWCHGKTTEKDRQALPISSNSHACPQNIKLSILIKTIRERYSKQIQDCHLWSSLKQTLSFKELCSPRICIVNISKAECFSLDKCNLLCIRVSLTCLKLMEYTKPCYYTHSAYLRLRWTFFLLLKQKPVLFAALLHFYLLLYAFNKLRPRWLCWCRFVYGHLCLWVNGNTQCVINTTYLEPSVVNQMHVTHWITYTKKGHTTSLRNWLSISIWIDFCKALWKSSKYK